MPAEVPPEGQPVAVPAVGTAPLGAQPPAQPAVETPPAANPREAQQQQQGKTQTLTHAAFSRIKDESRAAGREEAMAALAQKAGYGSTEEFVQALAGLKNPPPPAAAPPAQTPPAQEQPTGDFSQDELLAQKNARREQARYERQLGNLQRERDTLASKLSDETRSRKTLQEALDAKDAEMALREAAVSVGVKDVDYALRLLTRELEGKSEAEMAQFDERAYFTSLRQSKPYLFGEVVQPATTGTGSSSAPAAPRPAAVPPNGGRVDAMKMSPKEYQEELRRRGFNPNA